MKNCLVLDDEQHCLNILTEYISKVPSLRLVNALRSPIDAIGLLQKVSIDVAFVDIQMPQLTGLQFSKILNVQTQVVFCTAYAEYAVEGFNLNVVDYLLKPVSLERFFQCVRKLDNQAASVTNRNTVSLPNKNYIFVKAERKGNYTKVNVDEILFVEGLSNYTRIQLTDKQLVCQLTLKRLEDQLETFGFLRVHKSFLVAKNKISQIQGNSIYIQKSQVPIGKNFQNSIANFLKEHVITN